MTLVDALRMHDRILGTRQNIGGMMQLVNLQIKGVLFSKESEGENVHLQGYFRKIKRKGEYINRGKVKISIALTGKLRFISLN